MVQAGTLFEYLAAFITIVLGLALADLLVSLHRLLRARQRLVWRPLPLLLAVFVFVTLLTGFFEIWEMTRWERISYAELVWQVLLYVPLFLAACAVLPDDLPEGRFDLDVFYFQERRYIVSLVVLVLLLDVGDYLIDHWGRITDNPTVFLTFFLPVNLLFIAGLAGVGLSRRKWVHWLAFALVFAVAVIAFSGWAVSGLPALTSAPAFP